MVADLHGRDAGADLAHDAGALVAQDGREFALGVESRQRVGVGVADARRHVLDENLAGLRPRDLDRFDGERLVGGPGDGGTGFHGGSRVENDARSHSQPMRAWLSGMRDGWLGVVQCEAFWSMCQSASLKGWLEIVMYPSKGVSRSKIR